MKTCSYCSSEPRWRARRMSSEAWRDGSHSPRPPPLMLLADRGFDPLLPCCVFSGRRLTWLQSWRPGRKPGLWPGRRRRAGRVGRLFGWRVCGVGALPSRSSRRPGPWWRRVGMVTMKLGLFKEEGCGCGGSGECVLCAFRASVWIRPQSNDVDVRTTLWSPFLERGRRNGPAFTIESWQCKIRRHMLSAWFRGWQGPTLP